VYCFHTVISTSLILELGTGEWLASRLGRSAPRESAPAPIVNITFRLLFDDSN